LNATHLPQWGHILLAYTPITFTSIIKLSQASEISPLVGGPQ